MIKDVSLCVQELLGLGNNKDAPTSINHHGHFSRVSLVNVNILIFICLKCHTFTICYAALGLMENDTGTVI